MSNKSDFSVDKRIDLFLKICEDKTLDRTAIHTAAVMLLKHANSDTAKTVPGVDTIAKGMGRGLSAVSDGLRSLKVRWVRQTRRLGTSASYEWNWQGVSAEEWQRTDHRIVMRTRPQDSDADKATDSIMCTSPQIHIDEPEVFNRKKEPEVQKDSQAKQGTGKGSADGNESDTHVAPNDKPALHNPVARVASPAVDGGHGGHGGHGVHDVVDPHSVNFEHFWAVYPRREKKEDAREAFAVALGSGVSPQRIIDQAGRFARHVTGSDPRYIPYPATWLREKRWTDDYDPIQHNPYAEEDAQYPPCPPGVDPDFWRAYQRTQFLRQQKQLN
jgi:hypothetical protein